MTQIHTDILVVGHTCVDLVHQIPYTPMKNHKVQATKTWSELGGCAARVAQRLHAQSVATHLISVLGDELDVITKLNLQQISHMSHTIHHVNAPASVSHVWCDANGNRTISSYQDTQVVQATLPFELHIQAKLCMFDNYRCELVQSIRRQLPSTCVQIMDVDAVVKKQELASLQGFDQIWLSEHVWHTLGMSLSSIAKELNTPIVGITQGEHAVVWLQQGQVHTVQPPKVTNIQTTVGAGDAWRAGLAHALIQGMPITQAVLHACDQAVAHIQGTPV